MRKILFLSSLFVFLFTSSIWAADISGTWVLKYTGSRGAERIMDLVIEVANEDLTLTTTHPDLGEMAGTGTLKGNDIVMTLTAAGERKVEFEMKGTVTGNTMSGTRDVKAPERDPNEEAQSDGRGDSSGRAGEGAQMRTRGDPSDGAESGGRKGASNEAQGDSSSGESANTWTAEKK